MLDRQTGTFVPLAVSTLENTKAITAALAAASASPKPHVILADDVGTMTPEEAMKKLQGSLQHAMDLVQPDRSKQGPVFYPGEKVELKGLTFKIVYIKPKRLTLELCD